MMLSLLRCAGAVLFAALILPLPCRADSESLSKAKGLYDALRYEEAYQAFRDALVQRGNRPDEIADIYMHLGILAASMDRRAEAIDHFKRLLCVRPNAELTKGLPPKVARPFAAAQTQAKKMSSFRLVHTPVSQLPAAGGLELSAELHADSLGMATGLTLRYREAGKPSFSALRKDGSGSLVFSVSPTEIPPGQDAEYFLQLNDSHGGVLSEFGSERSPMMVRGTGSETTTLLAHDGDATGATTASDDGEGSAFYTGPWFLIAAGTTAAVVVAGVTTVAIVVATAPTAESAEFGPVTQEVAKVR